MSTPTFSSLLSTRGDTVEKPKPIPAGNYFLTIKGHELGQSKQKKTPFVKILFLINGPGDDVDQDQLEVFGGVQKLMTKPIDTDFYLTEDSLFRFKDFIEGPCAIAMGERSFGEVLPELVGTQLLGQIGHEASQDGQQIYTKLKAFAAIS